MTLAAVLYFDEHEFKSVLSNYGLFNTAVDKLSYAARSISVSLLKFNKNQFVRR